MASPKTKAENAGTSLAALVRTAGQQAKTTVVENLEKEALSQIEVVDGDPPAQVRPATARIFSILDYIEQPWGLNLTLYPVQKFIVKLYYHLPLESKVKTIEVKDMFNTVLLHHFTEVEYLKFLYEDGRCNIGVQDHIRRELLLSIGRRGGKCVTGDTLVLTDHGIIPIEELGTASKEDFSELKVGVAQEGSTLSESSHFYNGGVKPTYRLRTKAGYSICGTGNHRVRVMTSSGKVDWRYLDELRQGDFVAIHRGTDLWASENLDLEPFHNGDGHKDVKLPGVLDEKLGNLLGYLVGDGTWGDGHAISLTVEHHETWRHLRSLISEVFGAPRVQMDKRTKNTGRIEFCSVRARRFLDALGWSLDCTRDTKMIPWAILRSPKTVVCAFLRGLFETDGCAESGGRKVTFSTASFQLAHEVQVVLLNLGIVSSVHRKWNTKTERYYAYLNLLGVRSRRRFAELVGFDSLKKQRPLLASLLVAEEGKSDTESIPHQYRRVRDLLESIPKRNPSRGEMGWGRSKLRQAIGNTCKPGSGEDLTYHRLAKAIKIADELAARHTEIAHFEELLRLDYFYDPVTSVEEGEDQVYDLSVPVGTSFVANGMTNHNTTLSGIFASYEVYRLLNLGNPQGYYGLPNGNRIQIVSIATDKDQAGLLFNEVTSHLSRCEYFKPYIANNTLSHIQFRTPHDIEKYGATSRHENGKFTSFNGKATMRVTFKSCIAKGLRGAGNAVVIMDEMAHFKDTGQSSAKDIYDAVTPSTAAFSPKDPNDTTKPIGDVEARVIAISSPLNKQGKFYELYHQAMSGGEPAKNMIAIQAPTWEINPTVPADYYRQKYHADPLVFMTEHGAQFSDRVRGWIEREVDLLDCIDANLRPKEAGRPREPHQMGIDIGLMGDGTSIFITHVENNEIVLDYHESWYAGVDWRETNSHLGGSPSMAYARGLKDVERLDFEEIGNWIENLTKRFFITAGIFDRWNGIPLEQALNKKGLKQFKSEHFKRDLSSQIYQNTKLMMFDRKLRLYDWPKATVGNRHSPFIQELLGLQAEQVSRNLVIVSASETVGQHDDMADAFVRAVWLSAQRMTNTRLALGPSDSRGQTGMGMSLARYQMARARNHGGFSQRVVPRGSGMGLRSRGGR